MSAVPPCHDLHLAAQWTGGHAAFAAIYADILGQKMRNRFEDLAPLCSVQNRLNESMHVTL